MTPQDVLDAYNAQLIVSDSRNVQNVADAFTEFELMWTTGIGKSALVAEKCAATARSLGMGAHFIHPVDGQHGDVGAWRSGDLLVAVSASGRTKEVLDVAALARDRDLKVISVTSVKPNPLAILAHRNLYNLDPSWDPGHIPSASFVSACAVADALAVALAGEDAAVDHPGGEIGRHLSS